MAEKKKSAIMHAHRSGAKGSYGPERAREKSVCERERERERERECERERERVRDRVRDPVSGISSRHLTESISQSDHLKDFRCKLLNPHSTEWLQCQAKI